MSPPARWLESAWVQWWLGLEASPPVDSSVSFALDRPLPAWAWLLAVIAAMALAGWGYRRLRGTRGTRLLLAGIRVASLLLLAILVTGPSLRVAIELVERDWVVFLLDRSRSMTIADAGTRPGERTRDDALREALARAEPQLVELAKERETLWLGFSGGAFELPRTDGALPAVSEASGERTRLDDALEQALDRTAARPVTGIVVLSDGRSLPPPGRATLRRLQSEAIPVYAVPLGSEVPGGDLSLAKVDSPRRVFVGDEVPVRIEVERIGAGGGAATARIIDEATGEELASAPLGESDENGLASATLLPRPTEAGPRDWRVEIDGGPGDLVADNNVRLSRVEVVDRPLRVLYVEGYPRWEYRYLKNLLIREKTIDSSIMLLSADRDFAQEGNMPIARLPRTAEEFALFDVIILGDIESGFFSPEQLEAIREQVAGKGTGLLWIAGERSMPRTWEGSAMAELLPMRPPLAIPAAPGPVNASATALAGDLGLLRLGSGDEWPRELSDPSTGWSRLVWAQAIPPEQLKPTVETLAIGVPSDASRGSSEQGVPLITSMRYGAGATLYVATDEFWRYRFGRGERYTEQVWLPLIRMLGREALASGEERFALRAFPPRVRPGDPVRIELRLTDAALSERTEPGFPATVRREGDRSGGGPAELELVRRGDSAEWAGTVSPEATGRHIVRVEGGIAGGAEVTFECERPDDEVRNSAADHAALADLADATGGAVLGADDLGSLERLLKRREVRTEVVRMEPLWDSPLAFLLVLTLAGAEWLGRRLNRLA
jgi:hypothetical protein